MTGLKNQGSSPLSFATAYEAQSDLGDVKDIRSQDFADLAPNDTARTAGLPSRESFFRPAKELPYELKNHAYVFFSEEAYLEAIGLLQRLLEAGHGVSTPQSPLPAYVPPPQQLALLATLIVYPRATTHTKAADSIKASQQAVHYLKTLNKIVGPTNADLKTCFSFNEPVTIRKRSGSADSEGSGDGEDFTHLTRRIANKGAVWAQASSFWHVVGWAFNCSRVCAFRWQRWKYFLEVMLDVLETDWATRLNNARSPGLSSQAQGDAIEDAAQQSLIWEYIAPEGPSSNTGRRKILRAVFADGSKESLRLFGEVFEGESKEPEPEDEDKKKQEARDIKLDEDDFGDYDTDDDPDETMEVLTVSKLGRRTRKANDQSMVDEDSASEDIDVSLQGADYFGGIEALRLRQRILKLLADVALMAPRLFTTEADLFDNCTEFIRPLPTSVFASFMASVLLDPLDRTLLVSLTLFDVVNRQRPPYSFNASEPTVEDLVKHTFSIQPKKTSLSEHAKVSLLLEYFAQTLVKKIQETDQNEKEQLKQALQSGKLKAVVEEGIVERRKKATGDTRRRGKGMEGEQEIAREAFENSSTRILMHLDLCANFLGVAKRKRRNEHERTSSQMSSSSLSSAPVTSSGEDLSDSD